MGGKRGKKGGLHSSSGSQPQISMTLREESKGKKQGNVNAKTMLKLDHMKNLAVWAATEASVPSLGAFFGERLAAMSEALGLRADPSLFVCERCESILQPGYNCTVRIEKTNSKNKRRKKKSNRATQNNVVYRCHSCSHPNSMRGTPHGYLNEICPPKPKPPSKLVHTKSSVENRPTLEKASTSILEIKKADDIVSLPPREDGPIIETRCPETPLPVATVSLLDSKRRKRNRSGGKKVAEAETSPTVEKSSNIASNKRRKRSWTSLKEIACTAENDVSKKFSNLSIPFFI